MQYSASELVTMCKECRVSTKKLMTEFPWMRKEFLSTLLRNAMGDEKVEEATRMEEFLQNEAQRKIWVSIHRELNQTWNPIATKVEVPMGDGTTKKCNTKEEVEQGIRDEISERFSHADSSPTCQGALFSLLGYSVDTEVALATPKGTFVPHPGTTPSTMLILEEIERIWAKMGTGEVEEDFQY